MTPENCELISAKIGELANLVRLMMFVSWGIAVIAALVAFIWWLNADG